MWWIIFNISCIINGTIVDLPLTAQQVSNKIAQINPVVKKIEHKIHGVLYVSIIKALKGEYRFYMVLDKS